MTMRVAVAVSGRGSNLAALLAALGQDAPAKVVLVLSNTQTAGALDIARQHDIPVQVLNDPASPREWQEALRKSGADLIVLAGYLKRVPSEVVHDWRGRMINIHPALLPRHGGPGMYGTRVHEAVLGSGDPWSGATVHLVTEKYDEGEILGQTRVPVLEGDTPTTLGQRVLKSEHVLLPAAVVAAAQAGKPVPFTMPLTTDL
jgi:phosphoribosylglycinamide formyltransferase-1